MEILGLLNSQNCTNFQPFSQSETNLLFLQRIAELQLKYLRAAYNPKYNYLKFDITLNKHFVIEVKELISKRLNFFLLALNNFCVEN